MTQIDKSKVQLSESVKGTWAYAGTAARPTVADKSANFIFTPDDAATYSTATASFTLNIAPKELTPVLNLSDKMYDGSNAVTKGQNASVSLEGVLDKDDVSAEYKEISYDSENAGKHTATASGITLQGEASGNYTLHANSCQTESSITPYTGKVTVQKNIASRSYDGERHPLTNEELILTADETVDENRKQLTLDTDYTVSYSKEPIGSQENDMSITYTLSGKGNYEGCAFTEDTGSFTILKRPMPNASGSLQDASFTIGETYTPQKPGISVTGKDGKTVAGSISLHYKAENSSWTADVPSQPGKYSIGAYFESDDAAYSSGMLENVTAATLTVYKTLSPEDFTLDKTDFTYSGKQQQPAVSSALSAETDYTVSVPESVNAGDYEIKVEGKGYYTGEVQFDYTIAKAAGSGSVTMADYTYGDKAPAPVATSATNGTAGVSYTYTGRDGTTYAESATPPTNAGSYTVTASFKESANATACTATANFTVHPKGLVANDFTLSLAKNPTEFTYNGSEQKPTVLVADGSNLAEGIDYTVTYPDASTNAGSYKVTVTGKGNYTGTVELSYKINPAVYKLPEGAKITTELETYPLSIYGGQPLSHIGLKATGLPEGAQFGWKAGDTKLATSAGDPSYEITVDPNDPNYSEGTATVSVTLAKAIAPAADEKGITGQLSTVAASISKTASENGTLKAGAAKDIAQLTLSGKLTPKEQDDLKSAHLSDAALLDALDKSAENVTVSTQLSKGEKSALTDLAITTGGKAALGADNDTTAYTATYTATDITPEKPADGQLIEVELSLGSGQQPAVPVLVSLSFHAKNADPNGKFQVVHKHTETDASKNFTTQYDCRSVSKSGDTVTVQFLAASFSSFSIQYTAPASGGSSSSSSATPKPDEPQPQPTAAPAPTASETTWLGGYGALLNAKSGTALSLDVTACEYLPGYIITGVQKSGVTLNLSTPAGKLCLSPAVAKAMNGSYNYTFADALAISGKVAAAAKPAASPAPVKDPTAASPTPAPTPVPTAAPQPTQAPAPQPEAEPQEKSHSPLPMVAAVLVAAALLAGGYLAYNSASRRKALHDVYAPSKKVKLNQNQNNGRNRE
ncbi:MAG: YDG domain-containing protein [Oscillospiraceae bacterium]|nr:YDG domain-containing protein [Oscillospiraceae bacterium]